MRINGRFCGLVVLLAMFGCGKGEKKEKPTPSAPTPKQESEGKGEPGKAPSSESPNAAPNRGAVSKEKRAEYKRAMREGRKLGKAKEWGKAAASFEAALAAIPKDARALSELGWVAFQAGDYDKAAKANQDSVSLSAQPKVKAASLYNLGRVAEARGHKEEAAEHYQESLRLRPGNKVVQKRLDELGAAKPEVGSFNSKAYGCVTPMPKEELCKCERALLMESSEEENEDGDEDIEDEVEYDCSVRDTDIDGIAILEESGTEYRHSFGGLALLVRQPDGKWQKTAQLGDSTSGRGHEEEVTLETVTKVELGERHLLRIHLEQQSFDMWYDTESDYSEETTYAILCTLPDGLCGHRFPLSGSYSDQPVDEDWQPVGKAKEGSFEAKLELAEDGTATLTMVSGDRMNAEGFLGSHKLW